jgi:hypothetical protein
LLAEDDDSWGLPGVERWIVHREPLSHRLREEGGKQTEEILLRFADGSTRACSGRRIFGRQFGFAVCVWGWRIFWDRFRCDLTAKRSGKLSGASCGLQERVSTQEASVLYGTTTHPPHTRDEYCSGNQATVHDCWLYRICVAIVFQFYAIFAEHDQRLSWRKGCGSILTEELACVATDPGRAVFAPDTKLPLPELVEIAHTNPLPALEGGVRPGVRVKRQEVLTPGSCVGETKHLTIWSFFVSVGKFTSGRVNVYDSLESLILRRLEARVPGGHKDELEKGKDRGGSVASGSRFYVMYHTCLPRGSGKGGHSPLYYVMLDRCWKIPRPKRSPSRSRTCRHVLYEMTCRGSHSREHMCHIDGPMGLKTSPLFESEGHSLV